MYRMNLDEDLYRKRTQSFVQQSRRFSNPYSDFLMVDKTQILLSCVFIKDGVVSLIERPEEGFRIVNVFLNGNMNRIKLIPYISLTYIDKNTAMLVPSKLDQGAINYELTWDEKDKPMYKKIER